jgi:hypothetical protein
MTSGHVAEDSVFATPLQLSAFVGVLRLTSSV